MKKFTLLLVTALVTTSMSAMAPLIITSVDSTPTACTDLPGAPTGSISATVSGGVPPYTVVFINSNNPPLKGSITGTATQTSFTFPNLPISSYTITARDSAVPPSTPATASITLPSFCPVQITLASFVHVACNGGSTGSITVNATGGPAQTVTPPQYLYSLNGAAPVLDGPSHTFTGLAAGAYTVYVLPPNATLANLATCAATADIVLVAPAALAGVITATSQPTCNGGPDGDFTVAVTGGLAPYTVAVTGTTLPAQTGAGPFTFTGTTATPLPAGSYSVSITDANLCTTAVPVTITQQTALSINVPVATTPASCFGGSNGSLTIAVTNTTGSPVAYAIIAGQVTRPLQTSPTFPGLPAGNYTVQAATIPPALPFCAIAPAVITSPTAVVITVTVTNQDIVNDILGSIKAVVTGGVPPYTITLTPGGQSQTGTGPFTFSNLVPGSYTLTVVDANGCTTTYIAVVTCFRGQSTNALTNFITTVLCKGACEL